MESTNTTELIHTAAGDAQPRVPLRSNLEKNDTQTASHNVHNVVDVDFVTKSSASTDAVEGSEDSSHRDHHGTPLIPDELQGTETCSPHDDFQAGAFVPFDERKLAPSKESITLSFRDILNLTGFGPSALAAAEYRQHLLWMTHNGEKLVTTIQQISEGNRWITVLRKEVRAAWKFLNDQEKWTTEVVAENSIPKLSIEKRVEVALLFVFCAVLLAFGFYNTAALLVATGNPLFPDFWHAAPLASAVVILSVSLKSVLQILPEGPAQKRWTRLLYAVGLPLAAVWLLLFVAQFGGSIGGGSGDELSVAPGIDVFDQLPLLGGLNLKLANVGCQAAQVSAEAILSAALWCTAKLMIPARTVASKMVLSAKYLAAEQEYQRLLKKLQYWSSQLTKYMANKAKLESQLKACKESTRQKVKSMQSLAA
jgi:hypothetical protein